MQTIPPAAQSDTDPIQLSIKELDKDIDKLVKRRALLVQELQARQAEGDRVHAEAKTLGHFDEAAEARKTEIQELRERLAALEK